MSNLILITKKGNKINCPTDSIPKNGDWVKAVKIDNEDEIVDVDTTQLNEEDGVVLGYIKLKKKIYQ